MVQNVVDDRGVLTVSGQVEEILEEMVADPNIRAIFLEHLENILVVGPVVELDEVLHRSFSVIVDLVDFDAFLDEELGYFGGVL